MERQSNIVDEAPQGKLQQLMKMFGFTRRVDAVMAASEVPQPAPRGAYADIDKRRAALRARFGDFADLVEFF